MAPPQVFCSQPLLPGPVLVTFGATSGAASGMMGGGGMSAVSTGGGADLTGTDADGGGATTSGVCELFQ